MPQGATRGQPAGPLRRPLLDSVLGFEEGRPGLRGPGPGLSSDPWIQLGARQVLPKGCCLSGEACLLAQEEGRPRRSWVLAWVRTLIVKAERSRSEIRSVQHTCLGAGPGRDWKAIQPSDGGGVGEGPELYLMSPSLSHSRAELPWQANHDLVGRGSAGPTGRLPHLPGTQGGSKPGKGVGGGVGPAGGGRHHGAECQRPLRLQTPTNVKTRDKIRTI